MTLTILNTHCDDSHLVYRRFAALALDALPCEILLYTHKSHCDLFAGMLNFHHCVSMIRRKNIVHPVVGLFWKLK